MSDRDEQMAAARRRAREEAGQAFADLCCLNVAEDVCEECAEPLLYLASMHASIERLLRNQSRHQTTIHNLRRRLARHEVSDTSANRMRRTARDFAESAGLPATPMTPRETVAALGEVTAQLNVEGALLLTARLLLYRVMCDASGDAFCAGWHVGLASSLRHAVAEQSCEVGFGGIDPRDLLMLTVLSAVAGGWWVWDDECDDAVFIEGWEG